MKSPMLQSRVADSLYWIARYLERAGHTIRLIDVRLDLELDRRAIVDGWDFERLCAVVKCDTAKGAPGNPAELVETLVFDAANQGSVLACITAARDNARQAREEISSDMWEQLNALYLRLKQVRNESTWSSRPHYLSRLVIEGVHLFEGVTDATMGHGEGWQFLRAGRFLERAAATAALVDLQFRTAPPGLPADHIEWVGLLRSCAAFEAYVRCYTADVRPPRVAEFLLLNAEFPRSVRFAAARVESALRAIAQLTGRGAGGRAERLAGRLHASLGYGQIDEILEDAHGYLDTIGRHCAQIHDAAQHSYVSYPIESAIPA